MNPRSEALRRAAEWAPFVLLSANAIVTAWVVFHLHPMETAIYSDMREYVLRAIEITGGYYERFHFMQPIGYPLWIAFWRGAAGGGWWLLKLSHVALVWASAYLAWRVARRLLPARWDLLVLLLTCAQVQWWALASFALSETLYTFLVTLLLWCTVRWAQAPSWGAAAAVGLAFAAGFLVKGSASPFPLFLAIWTLARADGDRAMLRRGITHLAIMAAFAGSVALAHGGWAYAKYGHFKLGPDGGGVNFVEGKCPFKHNMDSLGYQYLSPLFVVLGETDRMRWDAPFTDQAYYWKQGWQCVRLNPGVLVTSARYVYYLFAGNQLWPVEFPVRHAGERAYEALFVVVIVPLFVVGMLGALRSWRTPLAIPALLCLALFVTVWVFKSELRFRVPFDAATMIYASYGAAILWGVIAPRLPNRAPWPTRWRLDRGRGRSNAGSSTRTVAASPAAGSAPGTRADPESGPR